METVAPASQSCVWLQYSSGHRALGTFSAVATGHWGHSLQWPQGHWGHSLCVSGWQVLLGLPWWILILPWCLWLVAEWPLDRTVLLKGMYSKLLPPNQVRADQKLKGIVAKLNWNPTCFYLECGSMFITGTFPFNNISQVCINMQFSCFDCFNVDIDCSNGWRTDEKV